MDMNPSVCCSIKPVDSGSLEDHSIKKVGKTEKELSAGMRNGRNLVLGGGRFRPRSPWRLLGWRREGEASL